MRESCTYSSPQAYERLHLPIKVRPFAFSCEVVKVIVANTDLTQQTFIHTILFMPIRISRDRKAPRTFLGEEDADSVLEWLNMALKKDDWFRSQEAEESWQRLALVIYGILNLLDQSDQNPGWNPGPGVPLAPEVKDALKDLNRSLQRYTTHPVFLPDQENTGALVVENAFWNDVPVGESIAVHAAVRLARQNKLNRLKLCKCGLWYYAKFSHQRFCSSECREKFWETSEERKEQKRGRAREYYEYHKVHERK
jgi:hypothetical protein